MKIIDLLKKDAIALNVSLTDKEEAIDKLISLHEKAGNLADKAAYKEAILAREAQGSTAIGEGIAVPHAKSDSVKTPGLSAITVPNGVDYGAPDSKPSDILFMIAAPVDGDLHTLPSYGNAYGTGILRGSTGRKNDGRIFRNNRQKGSGEIP